MNALKTSIVITNYNYGRFVARCIDSALAQRYPDTEVVVVDDARKIILGKSSRAMGPAYSRYCKSATGQGAAFNVGFRACHGDLVLFLDADDWLYPHAVARVVAALSPGVAQVQFRLHLVDDGGRQIGLFSTPAGQARRWGRRTHPPLSGSFQEHRDEWKCVCADHTVLHPSCVRISAEGYLLTVAPFCGRVVSIDEPLGAYVVQGTNYWAGPVGGVADPERFRRALRHDSHRCEALRRKAAERGLAVPPRLGLADPQHLTNRIGSLVMDPQNHPDPGDSRLVLALHRSEEAFMPVLMIVQGPIPIDTTPPSVPTGLTATPC